MTMLALDCVSQDLLFHARYEPFFTDVDYAGPQMRHLGIPLLDRVDERVVLPL